MVKMTKIALTVMLMAGITSHTALAADTPATEASTSATDHTVASNEAGASVTAEQPSQPVKENAVEPVAEASTSAPAANQQATQPIAAPAASTTQSEPAVKPDAQTTAEAAPEQTAKFTPEQEEQIGAIAKRYLLAHPEVLIEVSEKLDSLQHEKQIKAITAAVVERQDALLNDPAIPATGPADAKVALIEFFDYQCVMCARQAPVIQSLMKTHPEVRYIFMEWPIFASRWEPSLTAAETGLMIWQQKGADAYMAYHNALFAAGHLEGKMTQADIKKAVSAAGRLKGKPDSMLDVVARTDALAQNLGFQGTPGLIVMPINGANADNISIFPGVANASALQSAIQRAEDAVVK